MSEAIVIQGVVYAGFLFGILLPMLAGFIELHHRSDNQALRIDQSYARDPRFLGNSFRSKADPIIASTTPGSRTQFLARKSEFAIVVPDIDLPDGERVADILLSLGPIVAGEQTRLLDVYGRSRVVLGAGSYVRALVAGANVRLGDGTVVGRWIDSERNLVVGRACDLGQSASAGGRLTLEGETLFKRVFGNPVLVGSEDSALAIEESGVAVSMVPSGIRELGKDASGLAPGAEIKSDIVSRGNVAIGANATLYGSVKAAKDVIVGAEARIYGNVVARGRIDVGPGARIFGHVFADADVFLGPGAVVGTANRPKTLYAGRNVVLALGSQTYGWVITERGGRTADAI
ncbi:MAG: hypothetical protein PXZ07_03265 [Candidatus Eremiobacteraeota bacterium]|nr:hypothetical protein [Candidatus Eremiobacteraeota bacterium]